VTCDPESLVLGLLRFKRGRKKKDEGRVALQPVRGGGKENQPPPSSSSCWKEQKHLAPGT